MVLPIVAGLHLLSGSVANYYGPIVHPWGSYADCAVSVKYYDEASVGAPAGSSSGVPRLAQNSPNPFNRSTTLRFELEEAGDVRLSIYDLTGRLVRELVNEPLPAGGHQAAWDGRNTTGREVASGIYLARLVGEGSAKTVRISLLR